MPHQNLYKTIFGNASVTELENIAAEHPYFGLAHFFLLKDAPADHADADRIAARTALHFNNPYLLNQQLKAKIKTTLDVPEPEIVTEETPEETTPEVTAEVAQEVTAPSLAEQKMPEDPNEEIPTIAPETELVDFSPIYLSEETEEFAAVEIKDEHPQEIKQADVAASVPAEETAVITEEKKPEAKRENEELLFEPLHTTDYFASQGIKLSEEVQPTDKLGKQLRSFTEWLKTMKKVHDQKLPEGSEQMDASVNKLAEKSNKDEEIITEAMAEAYISQGKPEKAKDVYLKLSLLNPSKNAYFAAKIDQIAW